MTNEITTPSVCTTNPDHYVTYLRIDRRAPLSPVEHPFCGECYGQWLSKAFPTERRSSEPPNER